MKKIFVLILSFLLLTLLFTACSDISNITVPEYNTPSERVGYFYSFPWTGQGMDSLAEECGEEGYIHWVLNQAKDVPYAVLHLNVADSGWYDEENKPINMYPPEEGSPTPGGVYHFYTSYFDLEDLEAVVRYNTDGLGENAQLVISEYCPGEEEPVYGILLEEDFTGVVNYTIPEGWTRTHGNWYVYDEFNAAGGVSPEMWFVFNPILNTTFLLKSPSIDTSDYDQLDLGFNHSLTDYFYNSVPYTLEVRVSIDGWVTWTTVWQIVNPDASIAATSVDINLDSYAGQTIQIAWAFIGDSNGINVWAIDDIVVDGYY